MKILISDAFDAQLPERLKPYGTVTNNKEELPEADIVLVRSATKCTKEWMDKAKNVKLIIRGGVGMDNVDEAYAKQKGIVAMNTPEASSVAVAELAMSLMLAIPNKIVVGHNGMVNNKWLKKECERTELYRKTLGLIGIGRIAREVAVRAAAFGMKVIAYDPYVKTCNVAGMQANLDDLLQNSDYISLHVPLTPETKGIICKTSIAKMKNGVIIVNTGRAQCVIEEDVAEALKAGKIAGYGTDVWYEDPPKSSPIITAPNVVMTPHIGASSNENLQRISDIIVEKVKEFVAKS